MDAAGFQWAVTAGSSTECVGVACRTVGVEDGLRNGALMSRNAGGPCGPWLLRVKHGVLRVPEPLWLSSQVRAGVPVIFISSFFFVGFVHY